jgi:major membrane immunogen (membrane-anchored lipoprotein)
MKNLSVIASLGILLILFFVFSFSKESTPELSSESSGDTLDYIDGIYEGESQAQYTSEQFWGHTRITINNNMFTGVYFTIRDTNLHEVVDSMYGVHHYSSSPDYMQQCVNEDHAIKIYPQQLLQTQDIGEVDAISGATWSYNIFIASTSNAVKNAVPTGTDESVIEKNDVCINFKPNPFHSRVTMEYNLISPSYISLGIYDNLGRLTKQLVDEAQPAGNHVVEWDDCPSEGTYYCRMQVDDKMICNKIIMVE